MALKFIAELKGLSDTPIVDRYISRGRRVRGFEIMFAKKPVTYSASPVLYIGIRLSLRRTPITKLFSNPSA